MMDGTIAQKYKSHIISPPSNKQYGIEFSYSFWIYIKDSNFILSTKTPQTSQTCAQSQSNALLHIFHKGSTDYVLNNTTTNSPSYPLLQMPGVWLYPNTNKLNIRLNTFNNLVETADVGNIPLNMWVNVIIVLIGSSVDIYINGNLKKRVKLSGVPKINYGDFYVSNWGGFQGNLSRLRYFNYAIPPFLIDQIFQLGPSLNSTNNNRYQTVDKSPAQLSSNYWMTTGYPNSVGGPGYTPPII